MDVGVGLGAHVAAFSVGQGNIRVAVGKLAAGVGVSTPGHGVDGTGVRVGCGVPVGVLPGQAKLMPWDGSGVGSSGSYHQGAPPHVLSTDGSTASCGQRVVNSGPSYQGVGPVVGVVVGVDVGAPILVGVAV